MKKKLFIILMTLFTQQGIAQYTQVPDPIFEQFLLDSGIDTDGIINGQFLTTNALGVFNIDIDYLPIEDLTGIEAFIDLEWLRAINNNISILDLSQNLNLDQLEIANSPIEAIDLSNNIDLFGLVLTNCGLTTLDVSQNINLGSLKASENNFSTIDLSNNTNLLTQ